MFAVVLLMHHAPRNLVQLVLEILGERLGNPLRPPLLLTAAIFLLQVQILVVLSQPGQKWTDDTDIINDGSFVHKAQSDSQREYKFSRKQGCLGSPNRVLVGFLCLLGAF